MSQGLLGSLVGRIRNAATRRELVGKDVFGNSFYRKLEVNLDGDEVERRTMESASRGNYASYDPLAVSPQWRQWLSKTRAEPPTKAEMDNEAARQGQLRIKVAQLAVEERKRRLQAAGGDAEAAEGPSLERFVGQLTGKGFGESHPKGDASSSPSNKSPDSKRVEGKGDAFEPEAWRPGS